MNYIIMFKRMSGGSLEIQKIPRYDGRGMPRTSSPSPSSNLMGGTQQWEDRRKPKRGHMKARGHGIQQGALWGVGGFVGRIPPILTSLQDDGSFQVALKCRHEIRHSFTMPGQNGRLCIKARMQKSVPPLTLPM